MTVSIDSQMQQKIDRYCALAGVNRNTAFGNIMELWERLVYIPETEFLERELLRRKSWGAIVRQRAKAERGDAPDLTMDEIVCEIKQAREERRLKEEAK